MIFITYIDRYFDSLGTSSRTTTSGALVAHTPQNTGRLRVLGQTENAFGFDQRVDVERDNLVGGKPGLHSTPITGNEAEVLKVLKYKGLGHHCVCVCVVR